MYLGIFQNFDLYELAEKNNDIMDAEVASQTAAPYLSTH